jgi:hypothetical protein
LAERKRRDGSAAYETVLVMRSRAQLAASEKVLFRLILGAML